MAKPPDKRPTASTLRVLPMNLKLGDRFTDETGEYEIIGRPYTTNAGKDVHVRVRKPGQTTFEERFVGRARARGGEEG
jgi:hypothetical protein